VGKLFLKNIIKEKRMFGVFEKREFWLEFGLKLGKEGWEFM